MNVASYVQQKWSWIQKHPVESLVFFASLLVVVFIHVNTFITLTQRNYLEENGIYVQGTIEAINPSIIRYAYMIEGRLYRTQTLQVSKYTDALKEGDSVDVYYLADNPGYSEIVVRNEGLSIAIVATLDAIIIVLYFALRQKKKQSAEIPLGD